MICRNSRARCADETAVALVRPGEWRYLEPMVLANDVEDLLASPGVASGDQRVILNCVTWDEYDRLRELFDERPGVRMTYLKGALEIMVVSPELLPGLDLKLVASFVGWENQRRAVAAFRAALGRSR